MKSETKGSERGLDRIIAEIRTQSVDERVMEQAARRVWAQVVQLSPSTAATAPAPVGKLRSCADFQALMQAYLAKTLSASPALLLEDHVHACVTCRRALDAARSGARRESALAWAQPAGPRRPGWRVAWAMAVVLVLAVGLGVMGVGRLILGSGTRAVVQTVDGALYHVSDRLSATLAAGRVILDSQQIRTANGSSAVIRLRDDSSIEMSQRTDLWVSRGWRGTTIHLARGKIIVRAAQQRYGRLYVATRDCLISVKGTIFAVDEGMKGSRVSVIQGEVEVEQGSNVQLLHPGDQISTQASLTPVSLTRDISWSRSSGEYLALLSEFAGLHKQLEAIPVPTPRYDSTLLKMAPVDTMLYVAIPNLGTTLSQANQLLQERIGQSEVLEQWWNQQQASGKAQKLEEMINRIHTFSEYLGDEIVIALPQDQHAPLILAEVKRPGFREFLQQRISELSAGIESRATLIDDPFSAALPPAGKDRPLVFLKNNILVMTGDTSQLQHAATLIEHSASSNFVSTPFYAAIQRAYQSGAGWLLCADMEQVLSQFVSKKEGSGKGPDFLKDPKTGFADMRYLIMESKDTSGKTENRATISFSQDRRGIAAWLAPPSPMGTLDFVSPAASFVVSFVVKNPRDIVQEIISFARSDKPDSGEDLEEFESKTGVNLSDDLAGALGGEATFALDGPVLPTPSWKLALEVNDPARLEETIEKLVAGIGEQADQKAGQFNLTKEDRGGRTYYALHRILPSSQPGALSEIDYVFVDGYLVAAPNRSLLVSSLQNRETGYSLARSTDFMSRLPRDGNTNYSAVVYQNLGAMLGPVTDLLKSTTVLTPAQRQSVEALSRNSVPSLICAYGEPQQIVVTGTGSFFGLVFDSLLGIGHDGPLQLLPLIEKAAQQTPKGG
jgi:ferric-dicitrate binding protein FerR (iron transport regulator)